MNTPKNAKLIAEKAALRRAVRARLDEVSEDARVKAGQAVATHLWPLVERERALRPDAPIALFASMPHEIPTWPLDERLREAGVPRALPAWESGELCFHLVEQGVPIRALEPDCFGIPTPPLSAPRVALSECALVVVPGLAFDEGGGRLGYGKGYYDRALRRMRAEAYDPPLAVAILLDEQWESEVPQGPHDVLVDGLASPARGLWLLDGT